MPKAEVVLWKRLREANRHGYNFRRQHPIGPFIADFANLDAQLVIEIDGMTHAQPGAYEHDDRRRKFVESRGYKILRFQNEDIYRDVYWVMEIILRHVPPPSRAAKRRDPPPPQAG